MRASATRIRRQKKLEYMNGSVNTRLGAERARNGHPEPYHIKYWDIGNEPYGAWQLGRTDLKYYVLKHNEFAKAMRKADPSITLIASGNMLEDMDLTGETRAKIRRQSEGRWKARRKTGPAAFSSTAGATSAASPSTGTRSPATHFNLEKAKNLPLDAPTEAGLSTRSTRRPLEFARYPANIVQLQAEEWDGYQQRFPAMLNKHIFLSIDEYAYFGGGFGRAPI